MNNKYAVYQGEVYEATSSGDKINLIVHVPTIGFEKSLVRENYYKKSILKTDVSEFYSKRTTATYRKIKVAIMGESSLEYLLYGSHHHLPNLGFDEISRGEYSKWVSKDKISDILEVKQSYL